MIDGAALASPHFLIRVHDQVQTALQHKPKDGFAFRGSIIALDPRGELSLILGAGDGFARIATRRPIVSRKFQPNKKQNGCSEGTKGQP
ncbi:MAG: hypothetical protein ACLP8A_06490 [Methylovirgula sp.]